MSVSPFSGKAYGSAAKKAGVTPGTVVDESLAKSPSSPNLSSKDIAAGYSTVPGPYDAKTGKLKNTGNQQVDTSQPSPQTAQTQPPNEDTVNFDAKTGKQLAPGATTTDALGNVSTQGQKFKQGLATTMGSGLEVPTTAGGAAGTIANTVGKEQQQISPLGGIMEVDSNFDSIFTNLDAYMEPLQQKKSLLQEYKSMSKSLGIDDINEELIDAKKIIEGTEDDIRAEVTAAGGFATDSQVLAMSNARNKSLIKNYNVLLESRDNAMQQLDTMMDLTMEDRRSAEAEFDRKMNFAFKIADFQQRAKDNSMNQLNKLVDNVGYKGLFEATKGSAYEQSIVEKTLGLGAGGLSKLASLPPSEKEQLDIDLKKSALLTDKAQRAKIYSDIAAQEADGTVMVDQQGKVLLPQKESMKINKEIIGSDAYKAITKGKDSLQFLKNFEDTFNKTGATSAVFSPRQNAKLKAEYNAAILNLKEFFNLGVLNGPDEAILRGVLPDPTNRSAFLTTISGGIYKPATSTKSGIDSMKKMIESSLDERYKSLNSQYGDYSGQSVGAVRDLNRIYVEQKAKINPQIQQLLNDNPDLTEDDIISILNE